MTGLLSDVIRPDKLAKTGFVLQDNNKFSLKGVSDDDVSLQDTEDGLRVFLYPEPNKDGSRDFYSIGKNEKGGGLIVRKIGLNDGKEKELNDDDEKIMLGIIAESSQLKALGFDIKQEVRGFWQSVGDRIASAITEYPITTEILTGLALAAVAAPLGPVGATVAGVAGGIGVKVMEGAAEKRHKNTLSRRQNSLRSSIKRQQGESRSSEAEKEKEESRENEPEIEIPHALSADRPNVRGTGPNYHGHHVADAVERGQVSEHRQGKKQESHLQEEMRKRTESARQNSNRIAPAA